MGISAERRERAYNEAQTFDEFMGSMQVNQESFRENFASYSLDEAEKAYFESLPEPVDVLVLAHDWCGDVLANLPLFGRIEAATGKLRLRVIPRDPDNTDVAAAYPHPEDGSHRVPTYIFFNSAGEELGVFIERAAYITALQQGWRTEFFRQHPEMTGEDLPFGELSDEVRQSLLKFLKGKRREAQPAEKAAILEIIKPLLSETASLKS